MSFADALLGRLAYTLWDTKEGGLRLHEFHEMKQREHWPPSKIQALQTQKLHQLIRHAEKTTEWYKAIIRQWGVPADYSFSLADLSRFPITTKQDIRDNTAKFISNQFNQQQLIKAKTGGSTGVALQLFFDERCQQLRNAAQSYADNLAGWTPGTRVAAVWGNPPIAKTFKQKLRAFLLERTIYLDTMDLNPNSMNEFVAQWRRFKPRVLFGHAHSIYLLAQYLSTQGINDLQPNGIVATSMMLLDHERIAIERAFNCKVTNRYGCEEVGLIAVECEEHKGMHINTSHLIVECLDGNNQPAAPGTPGKLVITDLHNFAMPLIRYRVEDVGVLSARACRCGRSAPLLERLEGRVADFLKKPDGGQVAGVSLVERTLTKIPGIEQMQLIQDDLYHIRINRVKGADYTANTDEELLKEFRQVFESSVSITLHDVDKIPQEASGKYRFSICKI